MSIERRPRTKPKPEPDLLGDAPAEKAAQPPLNPRAVVGNNAPPPDVQVRADFEDGMADELPTWKQRIADLAASAARAVVDDDVSAGKAGDLVKAIRAMDKAITDVHKAVKQPYFEAGRVVDGLKNQHIAELDAAKRLIEGKQTDFIRARQARIDKERREAEARAKAEADAAAAAELARLEAEGANDIEALEQVEAIAAPAIVHKEPEKIRSIDTGAAVGGRKEWQSEVTDYSVAVIDMLNDAKVKEAIDNCAKRRMKAGMTEQPGVRCWQALVARTY